MIPDKRKPGYQPGQSQTEAQSFAAKENFALFLLYGMQGALGKLHSVEYLGREISFLREAIDMSISKIKEEQRARKIQINFRRKGKSNG